MTARIAAGFKYCWYGVIDEDGNFIGGTATEPTAGTAAGSGLVRLEGAQTVPVGIAESDSVVVTGDDEPLVNFEFDAEELPNGILEMAVRSSVYDALTQSVFSAAYGDMNITPYNPRNRNARTMCHVFSRRSKKWEAGVQGAKAWESVVVFNSTVKPLLTEAITQREFSPYRYALTTSQSGRTLWSTVNLAVYNTMAVPFVVIDSDNPIYVQCWRGNNSQQTFTMNYPAAAASADKIRTFVNDLQSTYTTDFTVTGSDLKTLSFGAAPATDAAIVSFWEVPEANLA